jgi:hypothetical protein
MGCDIQGEPAVPSRARPDRMCQGVAQPRHAYWVASAAQGGTMALRLQVDGLLNAAERVVPPPGGVR